MATIGNSPAQRVSSREQPRWTPRRALVTLGSGLIVVALLLFAGLAYARWQATVAEAEQITDNLADLLAEHAGRVFDASNLVADQAITLAGDRSWGEVSQSRDLYEHLRRLTGVSTYISAVWLVDETGTPRLSTRDFPAPTTSVADREHFKVQQQSNVGPFISQLLRSRVKNESNIVLSRRIEDQNHRFRGVALVVIDPTYFLSFYDSIKAMYPVAIDMFRADLAVVIHYPSLPEAKALSLRKWPDRDPGLALGESGTIFHARSGYEDTERLEAYQRIKGFPLYVSVGVPRDAIFGRWLTGTLQQGMLGGLALAALLMLVAMALARTRREEAMRLELEELNSTLEERVHERTAEVERSAEGLRRLLAEKDVLFREVHHRVKNNLQIISSLLNLYANKFTGTEVQRSFTDCLNQVRAMGLVHELLYRSPNMAEIDFDEYLRVLASRFVISFGRGPQVQLNVRSAPLHFDLDTTIPLALIVTEAITNAFKHAFPAGRSGTVHVEGRQSDGVTTIRIADDGVGLPSDWEDLQARSLGLKLLRVLAEQIDAKLTFTSNGGTVIELILEKRAARAAKTSADTAAQPAG
jgi:two-component system, sensor histidine kinase PdtaS